MVSSGIRVFRLKQSSGLAYDWGMLSSWEILLVEAGLKKLQMPSWRPWVHWLCFWPASKGLLGLAMGTWGHLLGWAFLKAPKVTSLGNQRFLCCDCHRSVFIGPCMWGRKELDENCRAGGCWGSKGEGYKAGGEIRYLAHHVAWSAPQVSGLEGSVSLRQWKWGQSLGQFPAAYRLALGLVLFYFFFPFTAGGLL